MEKTTTQRIIGILVVIALVIILLPLLFDKNEATAKVASVKAPPFPNQQNQPTSSIAPETVATVDPTNTPAFIDIPPEVADQINQSANATQLPNENKPAVPVTASQSTEISATQESPKPPSSTVIESSTQETSTTAMQTAEPIKPEPQSSPLVSAEQKPTPEKIIKTVDTQPMHMKVKKTSSKQVMKSAHTTKTNHLDLIQLKKVAWALQLGSFKNKNNARRLADKLRASGYKAFMHEIKFAKGGAQTRVYIGPEYKQAAAARLSIQVAQNMNMHGFIIPYKPLEL